jgi:formate C-acetyltransferase
MVNLAAYALLRAFAAAYNLHPRLNALLTTADGPLSFSVGLRTESGSVRQVLRFHGGRVSVAARGRLSQKGGASTDTALIFQDEAALKEMVTRPPNEALLLLLKSRMRTEGNLVYLSLFSYLLSELTYRPGRESRVASHTPAGPSESRKPRLKAEPTGHVRYLDEAYLGKYTLADFPRLAGFLDDHFTTKPEICDERPRILTAWFRAHGFEAQASGEAWDPVLRQGLALKHLLEQKAPRIRTGDLIAGSTTAKDVGVVLYPDAHGTLIWGELRSVESRELNPYRITGATRERLHRDVFPFWAHRNFKEWVRETYAAPLAQQIDERFAAYFLWKTVALSHTIPDFPAVLQLGTRGMRARLAARLAASDLDERGRNALRAMQATLEGMETYARHLAEHAEAKSRGESHPARKAELAAIAARCRRVPAQPAATLAEALQAMWITWVALHNENTNAGLSLGRLDQWLQPYFEADLALCETFAEREAYLREAIELVGCFFLRCADHLPLVPDIGNYLFGGSSSDQAITLGGVTPEGDDAVNDMTYVLLKVTELLKLRDPNVNARYSATQNDDTYLRRLCEVNLVTAATPSIHGDENVIRSLAAFDYPPAHVNDWAATGCVEPTLCGRHMGHTGSMMFNLVAALEMAMNDGLHPLMRWRVGPRTGAPAAFSTFEAFYAAFAEQLRFLVDHATDYNFKLAEAHALLRPTPLLSAFIEGPLESGRDVTAGGARYNTSGVACIGLSDVVDSLLTVKHLIYDRRETSWHELCAALAADFAGHDRLAARIRAAVPKFGSGNQEALAMAQRVQALVHGMFHAKRNYRGGPYTTGFWSMSNHVAFGSLTGALPSGRGAGKAFTPGLTPSPGATRNLLDNLRDVALLDPATMDNNVAFNVKYVPAPDEPHAEAVDRMAAYVKTYVQMGGLQMQLNVVSSAVLRDAMAHPENYRDLLVRISGYNAYFTTLNKDMQIELIERAEYGSGA